MELFLIFLTGVNLALLIVNVIIFGMSLKLYTEYFKDKSMEQRKLEKDIDREYI